MGEPILQFEDARFVQHQSHTTWQEQVWCGLHWHNKEELSLDGDIRTIRHA